MRTFHVLALLVPLSLAVAPAPAGIEARGCLTLPIGDPEIAASFARFDQTQSAAAASICAMFLNDNSAVDVGRGPPS